MASILKSKAIKNVAKGNTSAYYSYVEEKNGSNPVTQQLEKDLNDYMGFVRKKNAGQLKPGEHAPCKVSDALFDIWNRFESRITTRLFYQKLMQIGEFLVNNREYSTASWQCYDRYLNLIAASSNFEDIRTLEDLRRNYFPNGIQNDENSDVTFRALMGHCICMFYFTIEQDPKLLNTNSTQHVAEIMKLLRLIIQLLLEIESFCWLVYNGTIYMYTIGRYMMQYGQSKIVLEHLLFCCLAMECSIPLLCVKYLPWRSTIYAATCECYYDCKFSEDGETFARRSLSKINELYELEMESVNGEKGVVDTLKFREATIRIGCVLFKRIVFESRRKNKGAIRPKMTKNYKDISNQIWPRTGVEKLLNEMFDCPSAQFLAIEEALSESNRRIVMTAPAGVDDYEMIDVIIELLLAAEYLSNIQRDTSTPSEATTASRDDFGNLVDNEKSQILMAINSESNIQMKNFLKVVKFAFNYEIWDIFRRFSTRMLTFIQNSPSTFEKYKADILILNLLQMVDKYFIHLRKLKHMKNEMVKANIAAARERAAETVKSNANAKQSKVSVVAPNEPALDVKDDRDDKDKENENKLNTANDATKSKSNIKKSTSGSKVVNNAPVDETIKELKENEDVNEMTSSPSTTHDSVKEEDLLVNIAVKLLQIIDSNIPNDKIDLDIVVDITFILWKKCKELFQKYQTGAQDNLRWINKLENLPKWLFILNVTHESMCRFNISTIDPAVFAHCSLRLGLLYESIANTNSKKLTKDSTSQNENEDQFSVARTNLTRLNLLEMNTTFGEKYGISNDIKANLLKSKEILKKSLDCISLARASISRSDKTFLCDKEYSESDQEKQIEITNKSSWNPAKMERFKALKEKIFKYKKDVQSDSVSNFIADLNVELIYLYHKVSVRLLDFVNDLDKKSAGKNQLKTVEKEFENLKKECKRNRISESLLLLIRALQLNNSNPIDQNKVKSEQKALVESAYQKLLKAEAEDRLMYDKHVRIDAKSPVEAKTPPAPIVCLRSSNKIVVQPRNFQSVDGTKICWYRIFASQCTSVNSKARISDYDYPGCGQQVPANCDKVSITGLNADEKYAFAVAAYDRNGNLIGDAIGDSTDPILASSTLSILMNWAYLCQACYQIGEYNLALTSFQVLWNHFVIKPYQPEKETVVLKNEADYEFQFHQLNYDIVEKTSPLLLRKFLECFFIVNDIQIKRKRIYCDMLFDGKIAHFSQIERIKECEKLVVAIELAAWLNDAQIILQAVVQCYGLMAPLIYYNIAYEPIHQVLTHCMLILEELPSTIFQRKSKNMFDSLQHMVACSTYYLTDMLKKFNKKSLSNFVNLIGRKLIGIDDTGASLGNENDDDEADESSADASKGKAKVKRNEEKSLKLNELKALEVFIAKSNVTNRNAFFNMLTGNEEAAQIYAYIANNQSKYVYKELVKFRRRTNYFEFLINLLQKALNEELTQDINEWSFETVDWLQKRNASILGVQTVITRKPEVITVAGNIQKPLTNELIQETERLNNNNTQLSTVAGVRGAKRAKRRGLKKYKLLIPLDLETTEKLKLEEKQKRAIDVLYDLLPERYENWQRRKKLRKLFQEEAAFKSQFYCIWALNSFALLRNRIMAHPNQRQLILQRINSFDYLDPQMFLFDKSNVLFRWNANEADDDPMSVKIKNYESKLTTNTTSKSTSLRSTDLLMDEKINDVKDISDLVANIVSGLKTFEKIDEIVPKTTLIDPHSQAQQQSELARPAYQNAVSMAEFVELVSSIFDRFKVSTVIAHRGKQWTQLINTCKLMFNCINSIIGILPAITINNQTPIKLSDFFRCLGKSLYLAADNLLDVVFLSYPIEKIYNKEMQTKVNKWYDSPNVGKAGATLKFDIPLDDTNTLDLRFIKDFTFRTIQCLCYCQKWEKLCSIGLKFNALTSYKYAENLSPIIVYAQTKLLKLVEKTNAVQPHFERLKAELGHYPRMEDLLFINFKIDINPEKIKKAELGVKIDPRVHNIYPADNKSKELISVPLDVNQTLRDLKDSLEYSSYSSRTLLHARRLLTLYLLSKSNQQVGFFLSSSEKSDSSGESSNTKQEASIKEIFHANPMNYENKNFQSDDQLFVDELNINLSTVVESYTKCIQLLVSNKEADLATQAMHELGNIYHYSNSLEQAYKMWNDSLDNLTGLKDTLTNWRNEYSNKNGQFIDVDKLVEKCGIWGCILGGVLTSKMAQYYLSNDIELKTECCLLSATFFKSVLRSSIPYSRYDIDYIRDDLGLFESESLLPGIIFNNDLYRFDVRYVLSAMNFITIELVNAGHCLKVMPSIVLYDYFARNLARDLTHALYARLVKIEALVKLSLFEEAINMLITVQRGENLPHFIDDKCKTYSSSNVKHTEILWTSSKPIFDLNNLKTLELLLSLKLPTHLVKLFGAHLTCKFYLIICKLFIQMAQCLPCVPNMEEFNSSALFKHHNAFSLNNSTETVLTNKSSAIFTNTKKQNQETEIVRIFTKPTRPITLEFIKGCLLGTSKTIITKCLRTFTDEYLNNENKEKYCVSVYWQHEFKYECNIMLANVSDQLQLGYLSLQNIVEAMNEICDEESRAEKVEPKKASAMKKDSKMNVNVINNLSKTVKKGVYQVFDVMSRSHLNSRLWLRARVLFVQYMFNQLTDAGKAKGNDENIIRDFGDLKFYCERGIDEASRLYDNDSRGYFKLVAACLHLIRGGSLDSVIAQLDDSLGDFNKCYELSFEARFSYLKALLLKSDLEFSLGLLQVEQSNVQSKIDKHMDVYLKIQQSILDELKLNFNEPIECFLNKNKSYFNNLHSDIKNLFNPLLHYLVHVKLRLGSLLILKASYLDSKSSRNPEDTELATNVWKDSLNVLVSGLELNKVIVERSVSLEIEMSYKYAHCVRELFLTRQIGTLSDVVESYAYTINLSHNSLHDLHLIKSCYQELAIAFISVFDANFSKDSTTTPPSPSTPVSNPTSQTGTKTTTTKVKPQASKLTTQIIKSTEAAMTALAYATKTSNSIREKLLLPGHKSIKSMNNINATNCPQFVSSDLIGYYVFADRRRVFRDEIEEEILLLAPEFDVKSKFKTYDEKIKSLSDESNKSITWIHLLNYQTKLQALSSMRNLNTLRNGQNRFRYSEFYTLAQTPIYKSTHLMAARLFELNNYLKANLTVYKSEAQAPTPIMEFFKIYARKSTYVNVAPTPTAGKSTQPVQSAIKPLLNYVKVFAANVATTTNLSQSLIVSSSAEKESSTVLDSTTSLNSSRSNNPIVNDFSYLQNWPPNYDYSILTSSSQTTVRINESTTSDSFVDFMLTFNWYKTLTVQDEFDDQYMAIIAIKDSLTSNKIKLRYLSAKLVNEIHEKLAPLASIADTSLDSKSAKSNENDVSVEFLSSLKVCFSMIAKLFEKNYDPQEKKMPFELKASNIVDLESMFNINFGGFTNNESLKNYILNLFM